MEVAYRKEADCMIVPMPREVDHHVAGNMSREIDLLAESWHVHRIVFDFAGTDFMDSSGIGILSRSLIVPEYDGQKEILAHHEDMVIAIDEGEMRFQPEGTDNWEYAVVGMGFVEIVNNRVTLLVETAERPEEIDVARAREAKERAEEQMRQKQSIREYYHSRASLSRAMARLKGTSGRK